MQNAHKMNQSWSWIRILRWVRAEKSYEYLSWVLLDKSQFKLIVKSFDCLSYALLLEAPQLGQRYLVVPALVWPFLLILWWQLSHSGLFIQMKNNQHSIYREPYCYKGYELIFYTLFVQVANVQKTDSITAKRL